MDNRYLILTSQLAVHSTAGHLPEEASGGERGETGIASKKERKVAPREHRAGPGQHHVCPRISEGVSSGKLLIISQVLSQSSVTWNRDLGLGWHVSRRFHFLEQR